MCHMMNATSRDDYGLQPSLRDGPYIRFHLAGGEPPAYFRTPLRGVKFAFVCKIYPGSCIYHVEHTGVPRTTLDMPISHLQSDLSGVEAIVQTASCSLLLEK